MPPITKGDLHAWRDLVASEDGPPSTTRLVLLVLSLYMNKAGGSCYPKVETLAPATGLSERAIGTHLREAARAGWIEVGRRPGKDWRQRSYQATWPSPERGSGDPGSGDRRSGDRDDVLTGTTCRFPPHNEPPMIQPPTPEPGAGDQPPPVNGSGFGLPGTGGGAAVPRTRPAVPVTPPTRAVPGSADPVQDRPVAATAGPTLGVSELVNTLRETYPHPANRGRPPVKPNPVSIENWLAEAFRMGRADPTGLQVIFDGAKRARDRAERFPDDWRVGLKTWIKDAKWADEEEDDSQGPVIPPPSTGPRFTPTDWNQPKETNDRLGNGGGA